MRKVICTTAFAVLASVLFIAPASATDVWIDGADVPERLFTTADVAAPISVYFTGVDHAEHYELVVYESDGLVHQRWFADIDPADGATQEWKVYPGFGNLSFALYDGEGQQVAQSGRAFYHVDLSVRANPSTFEPDPVDGDMDTTKLIACFGVFPMDDRAPTAADVRLRITADGGAYRHLRKVSVVSGDCRSRRWDGTDDAGAVRFGVHYARASVQLQTYREDYVTITAKSGPIYFD